MNTTQISTDRMEPSMEQSEARKLSQEMIAVLKQHFPEHTLGIEGRSTYDDTSLVVRVRITSPGVDPARALFELHAESFGLRPDDFGTQITVGARTVTISGIRPRASKHPVIVKEGSKGFYVSDQVVRKALGREAEAARIATIGLGGVPS